MHTPDPQRSCFAWAQLREKAARAAGESADHAVPWKLDLAASAPAANASGLELESGCRLSDGAHCSSQCYWNRRRCFQQMYEQ